MCVCVCACVSVRVCVHRQQYAGTYGVYVKDKRKLNSEVRVANEESREFGVGKRFSLTSKRLDKTTYRQCHC